MNINIKKWIYIFICCIWLSFHVDSPMCSVSAESYSDILFDKNIKGCKTSMPSKGDVKVLVLAAEFADMTFADDVDVTLEEYFFGEMNPNHKLYPQESVNAFYERASFGNLHLSGDIVKFSMPYNREYYEQDHAFLVDELIETYKKSLIRNNQVTSENEEQFLDEYLKQYDANSDGVIDGIYIYCAGDPADRTTLWESYTRYWDGYNIGNYSLGSGCLFGDINTGLMIQETGHMLGLEDYVSSYPMNGLFSIDMMDGYMGDINAFHKMLMGWIETDNITIIKEGENSYSLQECTKAGECVIIAPDYDTKGLYSEFYLITYRDFEGNDTIYNLDKVKGGLCIYYVNATLNEQETDFLYNTNGSTNNEEIPLIKQIHADNEILHYRCSCDRWQSYARIPCTEENMGFIIGNMEDDCFFHEGDTFSPYTLPASVFYGDNMNDRLYTGIEVKNIVYHGDSMEFDAGIEEQKQESVITYITKSNSGKDYAAQSFSVELLFSTEVQWTDSVSSVKYAAATLMNEAGEKVTDLPVDISAFQKGIVSIEKPDSEFCLEKNQLYSIVIPEGTFADSMGNTVGEIIIEYSTIESDTPIVVEGIKLGREMMELKVGEVQSLSFTIRPITAANTAVTWQSSNEDIATVDDNGNVTAIGAGEAMITVTTEDGGYQSSCRVTVTETRIPVNNIIVGQYDLIMQIGDESQLAKTIYPENATNQNVTWESSNEEVATVDENGNVVAINAGTTIITVTTEDGGYQSACDVHVYEKVVRVEGVAMSRTELVLEVGAEDQLNAIFTPLLPTNSGVEWKSSNESVVTVEVPGKLLAIGEGEAVITVTTSDGGFQATCNVKVVKEISPILLQGVSMNLSEVTIHAGETFTIYAITNPIDADNQNVRWSSSDDRIVSVSQGGVMKAHQPGTAVITVTTEEGNYTAQCKVTVTPIFVRTIEVTPTQAVLQMTETVQIAANILPSNATNQNVTWSSSNDKIAMVDSKGVVTAIAAGDATITATAIDGSGICGSCRITVEKNEVQPPTDEQFPEIGTKITLTTGTYRITKASSKSREVTLVKPKNKKKTAVTIPATIKMDGYSYKVTAIADKAFKDNKKIKSVKIGGNVKKIGKEAFSGCKQLKTITIKSTVLKSIGKNAIKGINKKATIAVPKKQYSKYKQLLKSKTGYKKTMKIKK